MDAKTAAETISTVEPRIVVPLSFDVPGLKQKLGSVDAFCKQLGACERQNANRLKISKKICRRIRSWWPSSERA